MMRDHRTANHSADRPASRPANNPVNPSDNLFSQFEARFSIDRRSLLVGSAALLAGAATGTLSSVAPRTASASEATLSALSDAQAQYEAAMVQLAEISEEREKADYRLAACQAELEATNQAVAELEAQVAQTQAELERAQDVLAERIRASYVAGPTELLDVLLGSADFDSLVSGLYYAGKVNDADAKAIADVKELKAQLADEQSRLLERLAEQERLAAEEQARADELQATLDWYQEYTASLGSEVVALIQQAQAEAAAAQRAEREAQLARQEQASGGADSGADAGASSPGQAQDPTPAPIPDSTPAPDDSYYPYDPGYSGGNHVPAVVGIAWGLTGIPYLWGGTDPSTGFDCSGFAQYCYMMAGYSIPRTTYAQIARIASLGQLVYSMGQLQPGDLVFPSEHHVGIYVGDGMMIHAPTDYDVVKYWEVYDFYCGGCPV